MTKIITENDRDVFHCENKENLVTFVKTLENENNDAISSMIHTDFESLFELEDLMLKFQKAINKQEFYQEDSILLNDNIDELRSIIQKIKFKLLTIDKLKQEHQTIIDDCFSDSTLVFRAIECNKEMSNKDVVI